MTTVDVYIRKADGSDSFSLHNGLFGPATTALHALIKITGVVDWSEASPGDALFDIAILTLGHHEHLGDVAGYGTDVDRDLIRAWWSLRCLTNVRWLAEHGYGSPEEFPEVAVLRSRP